MSDKSICLLRSALLLVLAVATGPSHAAEAEGEAGAGRRVLVHMEPGQPQQRFEDTIEGFQSVSYEVQLKAGQSLDAVLESNNISNVLDVYAPGVTRPIHVGGEAGNACSLTAKSAGTYRIAIYLLRLAARDGQIANYTLVLEVGDGAPDH